MARKKQEETAPPEPFCPQVRKGGRYERQPDAPDPAIETFEDRVEALKKQQVSVPGAAEEENGRPAEAAGQDQQIEESSNELPAN